MAAVSLIAFRCARLSVFTTTIKCCISIQTYASTVAHVFLNVRCRQFFEEADLPDDMEKWIEINAERAPDLPLITEQMDPLEGAEERKAELGF